jgi:ABC-2 type transport system ATP-binding protein
MSQDAEPIIEVLNLEKQYGGSPSKAVAGISFGVTQGEIFGLLGPNGAGKTTTIGILTTRVRPTGGAARIAGIDVLADPVGIKPHIAVVPQRNNLDRALTAIENLTFHAAYFGIPRRERYARAQELLEGFGLKDRANEKVDKYSGGMAQRLLIARALMHYPDILFLDEPTAGLDPQARLFLWDTIQMLNTRGLTVMLTTHDMDEAERLCRRVAIMDRGRILALDTPVNLSSLVPNGTRIELKVRAKMLAEEIKAKILNAVMVLGGINSAEWTVSGRDGGEPLLRLYAERGGELAVQAARILLESGLELVDLHLAEPSLEDVFIHLTGKGLRN